MDSTYITNPGWHLWGSEGWYAGDEAVAIVVHGKIRDVTLEPNHFRTQVRIHVQLSCIGAVIKTLWCLGVVIAVTYLMKDCYEQLQGSFKSKQLPKLQIFNKTFQTAPPIKCCFPSHPWTLQKYSKFLIFFSHKLTSMQLSHAAATCQKSFRFCHIALRIG